MLPVLTKRPKLSLETIEFQDNDQFGVEMEAIYTKLQKKILDGGYLNYSTVEESEEVAMLSRLITARLGLKVDVVVDSAPAAILPFYSNKNHVFLNEFFRGDFTIRNQEKILRKSVGKAGTVNTQKARVGGIFSEYENLLFLNFHQLFQTLKLSVPEAVAVTLHELGHAFYACEYADRLDTNNQVLANVARELLSNKEKKDMVYVYREIEKVNPQITEEEVDKLINGNRVIAGYTWFRVVIGSVGSQMQNDKYSDTSFEQMADNFAARFGYGRQLLTALEKLHGHIGTIETSKNWMAFVNLMQLVHFFALAGITVFAIIGGAISLGVLVGVLTFLTLRVAGEDAKDYTYDELKVRYKRIRQEYVELLKNIKLPNDKLKNILADIDRMDRSIQETHRFNSLLSAIANFLFSGARDADRSIREQQLLEELSFNDLFVKSAQFKTIQE